MIGSISLFHIIMLEKMNQSIVTENTVEQAEFQIQIQEQIGQTEIISIIAIGIFAVITLLVGYYISKSVVKPINRLIESAEKVANGEEIEISNQENKKTEVDGLVNAFSLMTNELKQNLNEMVKQKKQIETILLHVTDGIIAFDMAGKIIHINPAATNLLQLKEDENEFDKIFKKLNIDINLEKIVYLENWTSS